MGDVEWPKDPGAYEQAVAVLLSCMHPQLVRVDGSGGDGGRDAQLTAPDGLHVFEMKSFTGRMTKGRRDKVEKSLGRAALLNPVSWDVIVPIDLNPTEEKWFSGLQQRFSFPLLWRGATWIKARLAEHPAVRRFYFANHHAELGHLLQEIAPSRQTSRRARAAHDVHPFRLPWRNPRGSRSHRSDHLSASPGPHDAGVLDQDRCERPRGVTAWAMAGCCPVRFLCGTGKIPSDDPGGTRCERPRALPPRAMTARGRYCGYSNSSSP